MNIRFFLLIILTSLCYSMPSYAVDVISKSSWDSGEGAGISYKHSNGTTNMFLGEISHSKDGEQRLYFYSINSDVYVIPEYIKSMSDKHLMDMQIREFQRKERTKYNSTTTTTMVFNGQAVKMTSFLETYDKSQKIYFYYTPETEQGHAYLINLFKKSKSPIKIVRSNGETLFFPSDGFTKVWNSNGGNAL